MLILGADCVDFETKSGKSESEKEKSGEMAKEKRKSERKEETVLMC